MISVHWAKVENRKITLW